MPQPPAPLVQGGGDPTQAALPVMALVKVPALMVVALVLSVANPTPISSTVFGVVASLASVRPVR